uniref:Peptidase A2 domain-containing protein n=1 Tax=Tetraselmis chuii TaxID=63592 RepID=A0A7S1XB68_9CHLO|mmetsp:Transcript_8293/g.14961  ORF Transcript_8293/g.14961 Transcript_8293/m.14961 type:complete len:162 (+) Transcript_8293:167-652(+)
MLSSIWSVGRLVGQPSAGRGFTGGSNPFLDPPRYIPPGGEAAADLSLRVHETLHVYDAALIPHTASAVLDTGNAGNTMITRRVASSLGLMSHLGAARTVAVRGVVAGATERVPVIPITYELKGKRLCVMAAVTDADLGCDVLMSVHDIRLFESDGYRLSTR